MLIFGVSGMAVSRSSGGMQAESEAIARDMGMLPGRSRRVTPRAEAAAKKRAQATGAIAKNR